MKKETKERLIAFIRLGVAFVFVWASIANAAGIDPLAVVEVLRYALLHPETLAAAVAVGIAWWYNENVTDKAVLDAQRNQMLDKSESDFYEEDPEDEDEKEDGQE